MFAIVIYVSQETNPEGNQQMSRITGKMIDLTVAVGGRFFLRYQLHNRPEQLARSYRKIPQFFAAKRKIDPDGLLSSAWHKRYHAAMTVGF